MRQFRHSVSTSLEYFSSLYSWLNRFRQRVVHNPYSQVLAGHHLSIRSTPRADRARKSPLTVEPVGWLIRNATRPVFHKGKLVTKRKKNLKRKRPVENAAAVKIRKTGGGLWPLFLDADSHSCLEKPPQKTLRLSHIYHRPYHYQSISNQSSFLKTIRGGCASIKKIPFLSGADGVVSKRSRSLLIYPRSAPFLFEFTNHPVCAAK